MRMTTPNPQWVIITFAALSLANLSFAITTHASVKTSKPQPSSSLLPTELSERQGLNDDDPLESYLDDRELIKKTQSVNVSESKSGKVPKEGKNREDSPPNIEVIRGTELSNDERYPKSEFTEPRENKNPRIYYGEAPHGYPHGSGEESDVENGVPEGKYEYKPKEKFYFPKNYINSKYGQKNIKSGLPGKRAPDHIEFDEEHHHGHEFPTGQSHHPTSGHYEEHEHGHGHEEVPFGHPVEEHHAKGHHHQHHPHHHHVSGYGYYHHHGSYRHTIGDKVDAVGKALQVLIPSALLLTGVSALFPNRVHVPTSPNNHRQKRSLFRRRSGGPRRSAGPPPPSPRTDEYISPEFDDIPSHILRAEHRIMEASPDEVYPKYGNSYSSAEQIRENVRFEPFKVFKGPGSSESAVNSMQNSIPMPAFPEIPDMDAMHEKDKQFLQNFPGSGRGSAPETGSQERRPGPEVSGEDLPPPTYRPRPEKRPERPVTDSPLIGPLFAPTNLGDHSFSVKVMGNGRNRTTIIRRRKIVTRKPAVFLKESPKRQHYSESQKSQYQVVKNPPYMQNHVEDSKPDSSEVRAEQEFMSTLKNLVTPDVAKAIVENKQEPPKEVDLSPDGPVMGLLNSYAEHENDTPSCQKRALCELAVRGKSHQSSKFESFLWSVATLVPDVFSEMYDLQEVFQAIRNERCARFECANPNLDLQFN